MSFLSKLKQWLLQDKSESDSQNITRQEMVNEIYRHFEQRFKEETTTESMLFPTAFYIYMNQEDYDQRLQSFSQTVKDVVNKIKQFVNKKNQKYKNYVPHAKYWLFQFSPMTEDTFLEGMSDDASTLEPKQLYIMSAIYPEDNEMAGVSDQRMVGTLHIKNSFKMNNLAINPNAIIGMDIMGKNRFRVPFNDLNTTTVLPTTEAWQKTSKEKTRAVISLQQQQYCFFTDRLGGRAFSVNMISDNLYISGKNALYDSNDGAKVVRINSELVLNPHLQFKAENDGSFSVMAYGTARLNEQKMKIGEWTQLPNNSTILLNDEIQILFKKK